MEVKPSDSLHLQHLRLDAAYEIFLNQLGINSCCPRPILEIKVLWHPKKKNSREKKKIIFDVKCSPDPLKSIPGAVSGAKLRHPKQI